MKSRIKVGDKVKIVKAPVTLSRYGYCCGYLSGFIKYKNKTAIVRNVDSGHVWLMNKGGCYQPEQLKMIKKA